jgi:hypothetical protein
VLESVAHGVPIIGWPLQGDQFFNCEMLEREWGACVEVARGNAEGSSSSVVERARLAEVLETVMGNTAKGAEMRRRVKEIQELMGSTQENGGASSAESLKKLFTSVLHATVLMPVPADVSFCSYRCKQLILDILQASCMDYYNDDGLMVFTRTTIICMYSSSHPTVKKRVFF